MPVGSALAFVHLDCTDALKPQPLLEVPRTFHARACTAARTLARMLTLCRAGFRRLCVAISSRWSTLQVSVGATPGEAKSHQEGQFSAGQWVMARFVVCGDAAISANRVGGSGSGSDMWYGGVVRETRTRMQGSKSRYEVQPQSLT
jgi:hypothetical protein